MLTRSGVREWTIAAVLAIACLAGAATAGASTKTHAVRVFGAGGHVVATFTSANCQRTKKGFSLLTGRSHGWIMYAQASPFTGFHHYSFTRGYATGTYVELASPSRVHFASDFKPPYRVPAGGGLNFANKGSLVGVGFHPMFSTNGTQAITVTGVLNCRYPKARQ